MLVICFFILFNNTTNYFIYIDNTFYSKNINNKPDNK